MDRRVVLVSTAVAVLAVPGVASAHRYRAWAGNPTPPPSSAPGGTTINAFLPAKLTIRKGDSVKYGNRGPVPHTVSVLGKGVKAPPLAGPKPDGSTAQGFTGANGVPFWFNGQPLWQYNPAVFGPVGSRNVKDTKTHSSGAFVPTSGPVGNVTMKFSRPGKYKVVCLIHPGMQQTVVVRRKGRGKVDSKRKVSRAIKKQAAAGFRNAAIAAAQAVAPNTVLAGAEIKNASVLGYLPSTLTVARGTTVTIQNASPTEVHNLTFGPDAYVDNEIATTDLIPQPGSTQNQFSPFFVYGSEPGGPPGTPPAYTYSGANFGNGFLWTALMDDQPAIPLPESERITFTQPGTYHYFCAIHGRSMAGDIIVQ